MPRPGKSPCNAHIGHNTPFQNEEIQEQARNVHSVRDFNGEHLPDMQTAPPEGCDLEIVFEQLFISECNQTLISLKGHGVRSKFFCNTQAFSFYLTWIGDAWCRAGYQIWGQWTPAGWNGPTSACLDFCRRSKHAENRKQSLDVNWQQTRQETKLSVHPNSCARQQPRGFTHPFSEQNIFVESKWLTISLFQQRVYANNRQPPGFWKTTAPAYVERMQVENGARKRIQFWNGVKKRIQFWNGARSKSASNAINKRTEKNDWNKFQHMATACQKFDKF